MFKYYFKINKEIKIFKQQNRCIDCWLQGFKKVKQFVFNFLVFFSFFVQYIS